MITYDTLNYYNENAELYCEQTKVGNVQENYDRFLRTIPDGSYILDFGCGSGRDSKYFIENGYKVRAIDVGYLGFKKDEEGGLVDVGTEPIEDEKENVIQEDITVKESEIGDENESIRQIIRYNA